VSRLSDECLVILSARSVDSEAIHILEAVRCANRDCPVLVVTTSLSTEAVLCAMRAGASDLLESTAPEGKILETISSLAHRFRQTNRTGIPDTSSVGFQKMVGSGPAMTRVKDQMARVTGAECNVLITGESGTGKELAAELIHHYSPRRARPFVAVNCAAMPDTLLESELFGHERGAFTGADARRDGKLQYAAGGTLFLDEVGDMSLTGQAKILRAIESRVIQRLGSNIDTHVQVRIIAATNHNLEKLVPENKFRQDLYYRLNVARLGLPPLRERREDIPELAEHIVRQLSARQNERPRRIENEVIKRFQQHDWPGNIRELRNVLESILVFSSSRTIGLTDLPAQLRSGLRPSGSSYNDEHDRILEALNSTSWNRNKAAQRLSCSRMTLYRNMRKHAISINTHCHDRAHD
jgi:DNA-binding NtrC family response regulator